MNEHFIRYENLLLDIDKQVKRLESMHKPHLQCRMGCDFCCMDYSVFPVEFFAILNKLKGTELRFNENAADDECVFLVNHACMIYGFRPVICRTHGLPLLYMNDSGEWELSVCELNFTDFEEDFHSENTFAQDRFNSKLFMLNKSFITLEGFNHFSEFDLVPLRNLKEYF